MEVFKLPDLGEGLPDAEIVEWHVKQGDSVVTDQALVSMETAKAVVDVPAPLTGTVVTLHGQPGDIIETGAPLVTFQLEGSKPAVPDSAEPTAATATAAADSGTVVGQVETSDAVVTERTIQIGQFKATPAVRATARKLNVDLGLVQGSGRDGVITLQDVKQAAARGPTDPAARSADTSPAMPSSPAPANATSPSAAPPADDAWVPVRGPRRSMARAIAEAHAQVVPTTITERADLALWGGKQDLTVRLIRAVVSASRAEPSLNAWFDADGPKVRHHQSVNVGIAVDTPDGLFVSNLRDAELKDAAQLRADLDALRDHVKNRSIPPADLTGYTIMLSNVGVYAGRYTTPIITPPCVAILAVGKLREEPVATFAGIAAHPLLPLSLTFDHRAVTGGEAARFVAAFCEDLTRAG